MMEGDVEQHLQPAVPSQLDDFTFMQRIGHGSFGTVHKVKRKGARRLSLSRGCARTCCSSLSAHHLPRSGRLGLRDQAG